MNPIITEPAAPPRAPAPQPAVPPRKDAQRADPCGETDVWWGSYAGRTILPGALLGLTLTALLAWLVWKTVPRELVKLTFVALAGSVWLAILVRWGYRYFGYTCRLTTHRLFVSRGFLYGRNGREVDLAVVAHVRVKRSGWEQLLGTGRLFLVPDEATEPPALLEGIKEPLLVAELIRETSKKARERKVTQARV